MKYYALENVENIQNLSPLTYQLAAYLAYLVGILSVALTRDIEHFELHRLDHPKIRSEIS